jgi:hypothetical protein
MVNRRDFVGAGAALAGALTMAPLARARRSLPTVADLDAASVVIVDRAVAAAAAFTAEAIAAGIDTQLFERDAAGLWMNEIEPRLRAGPTKIAGLTSAATLFCLDFMARDYGAAIIARAAVGNDAVTWVLATQPARRAPLAPRTERGS